MLILRVKFHAQKEFLVDFEPDDMYTSKRNKDKRDWAIECVRNYEDKPAGAVRALVV